MRPDKALPCMPMFESPIVIAAEAGAAWPVLPDVANWPNWLPAVTTVVLLSATLVGCYSGDGEFESHGVWPFTSYSLDLPEWQFEDGVKKRFEIRGWPSHRTTFITLSLESPEPVVFAQLSDELRVTVAEPSGRVVLRTSPGIFSHLRNMQVAGRATWPSDGEWLCRHVWADPDVNDRAVPFMADAQPEMQLSIRCWQSLPMPGRNYDVSVSCHQCGDSSNVTATLTLQSGWK